MPIFFRRDKAAEAPATASEEVMKARRFTRTKNNGTPPIFRQLPASPPSLPLARVSDKWPPAGTFSGHA